MAILDEHVTYDTCQNMTKKELVNLCMRQKERIESLATQLRHWEDSD